MQPLLVRARGIDTIIAIDAVSGADMGILTPVHELLGR